MVYHHAPAFDEVEGNDVKDFVFDTAAGLCMQGVAALGSGSDASGKNLLLFLTFCVIIKKGSDDLAKKYLLTYSEQLATEIELLCQNTKAPKNTLSDKVKHEISYIG